MDWVRSQLTENKTKKSVGDAVIKLIGTWSEIKTPPKIDISKEVLSIFSTLAMGHPLVDSAGEQKWEPVRLGDILVADVVRIKTNAFDSSSSHTALNGRIGKVVGIRSGDIIVKSTDDVLPLLDGLHFKVNHLDKLIK